MDLWSKHSSENLEFQVQISALNQTSQVLSLLWRQMPNQAKFKHVEEHASCLNWILPKSHDDPNCPSQKMLREKEKWSSTRLFHLTFSNIFEWMTWKAEQQENRQRRNVKGDGSSIPQKFKQQQHIFQCHIFSKCSRAGVPFKSR